MQSIKTKKEKNKMNKKLEKEIKKNKLQTLINIEFIRLIFGLRTIHSSNQFEFINIRE